MVTRLGCLNSLARDPASAHCRLQMRLRHSIPISIAKIQHMPVLQWATCLISMAGAEGIEPSSVVLETTVLPLNYAPKKSIQYPEDSIQYYKRLELLIKP